MAIVWTSFLLLLAAILCVLIVIHALARMLLAPPRMTDGKALYVLRRMSPEDLGMSFETVWFQTTRTPRVPAIRIAAWWIEASMHSAKTVVLIHGYGDAKVGALAWAPTWRSLGYNCLLIDLRAHGESGGTICTGGVLERDDLDAVLDQFRASHEKQTGRLVLFGISLGGAVALATAARRSDIDAVVADSVYADYASAAHAHGKLIGAPLPRLLPFVTGWAQRLAGVNFADARPLDSVARCGCPVLLVHGDADPFVPAEHVEQLDAALAARHNLRDDHWIVPEALHVLSLSSDAEAYRARLERFLREGETA